MRKLRMQRPAPHQLGHLGRGEAGCPYFSSATVRGWHSSVPFTVNTQDDAHRLQADLNKLAEWGQRWLMEFNALKKCQVLRVTRRRHIVEHQYTLHGKELETCPSAKYLGITISSDLRWNKHVDEVCSKANKTLGFVQRNLRVSSPKTLAYFSLVRPLVEYAAPAWDPHTDRNINKLEKVRFASNRYNTTSSVCDMIKHLQWPSLQQRREILRLVLLYIFIRYTTNWFTLILAATSPQHTGKLITYMLKDTRFHSAVEIITSMHSFQGQQDHGMCSHPTSTMLPP